MADIMAVISNIGLLKVIGAIGIVALFGFALATGCSGGDKKKNNSKDEGST